MMPPARTPSPPPGGADYPEESAPRIEEGRMDNRPGDHLGQARRDSLVSETNTDTIDSSINFVMDLAKDDTETPLRRRRNGSISGSSTMSILKKDNVWDRIMQPRASFTGSDFGDSERDEIDWREQLDDWWARQKVQYSRTTKLVRRHPSILLWSFLLFAIIISVGSVVVVQFAQNYEDERIAEAREVAAMTGAIFSEQLDRAILPLFSIAQFVYELQEFRSLAAQIGQVGTPGALPLLPPRVEGGDRTHRNISGVCDDPQIVKRFGEIASTIKTNAKMDGILVNLQLAPAATVCLLHPLNNTEDFPPGIFMDNSGAVGHDLFTDPQRRFIAEATIPAERVVTAGPLPLRQCGDCNPTVEKAFIARLPIYMDEYSMEVGGKTYPAYGFAVALINWQALVDRSNVFETFEESGDMGFMLTRTDRKYDEATDTFSDKVVVLAEYRSDELNDYNSVVVELETTDNEWEILVGFPSGLRPDWFVGALVGVSLLSVVLFSLVFLVLVSKNAHLDLLKELFPLRTLKRLNKAETVIDQYRMATVFFSDIVGYTSMSSDMNPVLLMELLNSFYAEMDRISEECGVYKIETVGDAYMVTGGCPDRCTGPEGAEKVARFAIAAIDMLREFKTPSGINVIIRVGLNSGPLVAGVVGTRKPHYTVFGDTVNVASRMESTSLKMKIQCSDMTYRLLRDAPKFNFDMESRGETEIKGKGFMHTWWVHGCSERTPNGDGKAQKDENETYTYSA